MEHCRNSSMSCIVQAYFLQVKVQAVFDKSESTGLVVQYKFSFTFEGTFLGPICTAAAPVLPPALLSFRSGCKLSTPPPGPAINDITQGAHSLRREETLTDRVSMIRAKPHCSQQSTTRTPTWSRWEPACCSFRTSCSWRACTARISAFQCSSRSSSLL